MRNKTEKQSLSPPTNGQEDSLVTNACCTVNNVCSELVESPAIEPPIEEDAKVEQLTYLPKLVEIPPSNVSSPALVKNSNWLRLEELKYISPYIRLQKTQKRPRK
jgi:hypothetical protein